MDKLLVIYKNSSYLNNEEEEELDLTNRLEY